MYGYSSYGSSSYSSSNRTEEYRPVEKAQPLDTVSSILWDPYHPDPAFFASSWDGYVRYYLVKGGMSSVQIDLGWEIFLQHPVLCCDINPEKVMFAGLATGDIAAIQMEKSSIARVGYHDAPICGLFWLQEKGCLMSLGFDDIIRFWALNGSERP
jgi:WD40 repeat protein